LSFNLGSSMHHRLTVDDLTAAQLPAQVAKLTKPFGW
jgi:hypothetical protein